MTNLTVNMTKWTNMTSMGELFDNANTSTSGLMGVSLLIMVWAGIFFLASRRATFSKAAGASFFFTMICALFLQTMDYIGWEAAATSMVGFVVCLVIAYLEGRE